MNVGRGCVMYLGCGYAREHGGEARLAATRLDRPYATGG
jgi:hypothetical protein